MPSALPAAVPPPPQTSPEPWGKLQRASPQDLADPSRAPRLSLVSHCIDVAAVVAALLELPTWQARLGVLAKRRLSTLDLSRLCALAFLHDVGKAGAGFYSKGVAPDLALAWRQRNRVGPDQVGHVTVVAPLFAGDASFAPWQQALGVDLELPEPWLSPLQQTLTRLTVPRWMLPGLAGLPQIEHQHADSQGLTLTVAGRQLRYDRLGLRRL